MYKVKDKVSLTNEDNDKVDHIIMITGFSVVFWSDGRKVITGG